MQKTFYKRKLPHWHPPGSPVFLTWRLFGSLPERAIERLRQSQKLLQGEITNARLPEQEYRLREYKKLFAAVDTALDRAEFGPIWLKDPSIASMVQHVLLSHCATLYSLWAYVVMSNHVHVFLQPKLIEQDLEVEPAYLDMSIITKRLKGFTSREANRVLGRVGTPFWQDETFDHWSRDEAESYRIIAYIENNPVKAGLVREWTEWRWSYFRYGRVT